MAFSPVGLDTYAYMVLACSDATSIFDRLRSAGTQGNPQLPAAPDANYSYLTSGQWAPVGQLRADDDIITKTDNVYFGAVLRCTAGFGPFKTNDLLVAVKGTSDPAEWADDGASLFPTDPQPGEPGDVALGFWRLYQSLDFAPWADGNQRSPLIAQIAGAISSAPFDAGVNKLYVIGHSLGAALASYLTYDLWEQLPAPSHGLIAPYFFASPKIGTTSNVQNYAQKVQFYNLTDYVNDVVPKVPPDFLGYADLPNLGSSQNALYLKPNGQPWIPGFFDVPKNHSCVLYARLLDPNNAEAFRRQIQ
jgi:hypothetical protein